jgi:hypothetical protein
MKFSLAVLLFLTALLLFYVCFFCFPLVFWINAFMHPSQPSLKVNKCHTHWISYSCPLTILHITSPHPCSYALHFPWHMKELAQLKTAFARSGAARAPLLQSGTRQGHKGHPRLSCQEWRFPTMVEAMTGPRPLKQEPFFNSSGYCAPECWSTLFLHSRGCQAQGKGLSNDPGPPSFSQSQKRINKGSVNCRHI